MSAGRGTTGRTYVSQAASVLPAPVLAAGCRADRGCGDAGAESHCFIFSAAVPHVVYYFNSVGLLKGLTAMPTRRRTIYS